MQSVAQDLSGCPAYKAVASANSDKINYPLSDFILKSYQWYKTHYDASSPAKRSTNGHVFERLIIDALIFASIQPVYYHAKVMHIPHVEFDIFLYHPIRPVAISCKTSLRERWKQAALEGLALKQVYGGAQSTLVTMAKEEGLAVQNKIKEQEVFGLDNCFIIDETNTQFDVFLDQLKKEKYQTAEKILPVTGGHLLPPILKEK